MTAYAEPCFSALDRFRDGLPYRPYCTDDFSTGLLIRGRDLALKHRYIQHNPPVLRCWLVFDIDRHGGVWVWKEADLPSPNLTAMNPKNGHAHLLYGLLVPVCTSNAARQGPLRLAAAIEHAYTDLLEADRGYAGLIVKNPFHPDWVVECFPRPLYELQELADWVDLDKHTPKRGRTDWGEWGLGRNCTLFARLGPEGKWAYREIRRYWNGRSGIWYDRVLTKALEWNGDFPTPLPYNEVRSLARSVAKFTWEKFTPKALQDLIARTHAPELQAERGRKSGIARRVEADQRRAIARELRGQGKSLQEIAQTLGVSVYHVRKYIY